MASFSSMRILTSNSFADFRFKCVCIFGGCVQTPILAVFMYGIFF